MHLKLSQQREAAVMLLLWEPGCELGLYTGFGQLLLALKYESTNVRAMGVAITECSAFCRLLCRYSPASSDA